MNVLVVGQGGREHALAWKLSKSKQVSKIFVAPGNGGTANEAKCLNKSINVNNFSALEELVNSENIELIVVGPEDPLVNGINDYFKDSGVKVFGPTKEGAQLEGSKIFSKKFMFENNIPTGTANFFSESKLAKNYLQTVEFPIVLKADGLAAGKGVLVAKELGEAMQWIEDVMEKNKFGDAGNEVLIEECLFGTELSYMGIMTPKGFYPFETSVDYKPLLDGNSGPNTGGMGCMSPSPFMNSELLKNINEQVVEPTAHGLRKAKIDFYGFMYFGLMVKDNQPKVLEYNCRLGDPETQCLMLQLESDILEVLLDALSDNLENISWSKESSMGVVIASGGYPESYKKDQHIEILDLNEVQLFHAGTKKENGELLTSGGRVFSLNAKAQRNFCLQERKEFRFYRISKCFCLYSNARQFLQNHSRFCERK